MKLTNHIGWFECRRCDWLFLAFRPGPSSPL